MKHRYYPFEASPDYLSFDFVSCSDFRKVRKRVEFVPITNNIYNLAFGDIDEKNDIDDEVVTDNKDMEWVLATVIKIVMVFLSKYACCSVYFKGSTPSRTRLYKILLGREAPYWTAYFEIYGMCSGQVLAFEKRLSFESFIIKRKTDEEDK